MSAFPLNRNVPLRSHHDVVVVGGGTAGVVAAIAAARTGARTLLIESQGVLGGTMTAGLVTPIGASSTRGGARFGGIMWEILDQVEAMAREGLGTAGEPHAAPHVMAEVLRRMVAGSGVQVLLRTSLIEAVREGDRIARILVHNKGGLAWIGGGQFIDATGDADLIHAAGEATVLGSEPGVFDQLVQTGYAQVHEGGGGYDGYASSGLMQPVTLFFTMGGVDVDRAMALNNRRLTYADVGLTREAFLRLPYANSPGFEVGPDDALPLPQGRVLVTRTPRPGVVAVNMSRLTGVDGTDPDQLSRAELAARGQVFAIADLLIRHVPGFAGAWLAEMAPSLGVRETRRLVGRQVLSGSDAIRCVRHPDAIAQGSYMIDIHDPQGRRKAIGGDLSGDCFDIPFGCLVPRTVANLLAAGRCISVDHVAHSSTRIQGTCMLTGQAAGTAAALAVAGGTDPGRLDAAVVQRRLVADGVILHHHHIARSTAGG